MTTQSEMTTGPEAIGRSLNWFRAGSYEVGRFITLLCWTRPRDEARIFSSAWRIG